MDACSDCWNVPVHFPSGLGTYVLSVEPLNVDLLKCKSLDNRIMHSFTPEMRTPL